MGLPSGWNTLDIISLHKKGSTSDPNNYRGLSIMHAFAKLFASCLNIKLTDIAEKTGLRADIQAGFRSKHRTDD